MQAHIGDHIVVDGRRVGERPRHGEITAIAGTTFRRYRVRWTSGTETIFVPDSDCTVVSNEDHGSDHSRAAPNQTARTKTDGTKTDGKRTDGSHSGGPPRSDIDLRATRRRTDRAEVWFDEDATHTEARVTLHMRDYELTGFGRAQRNPHDPSLPAVGEELAAARAMSDLAHQLLDLATYQLEKIEGHSIQITL